MLRDLLRDVTRQLPNLYVFEAQLATRVASGNVSAHQRRHERFLLRFGPAAKVLLEIVDGHFHRRTILISQRALKIVEAAAQGALGGEEEFESACHPDLASWLAVRCWPFAVTLFGQQPTVNGER